MTGLQLESENEDGEEEPRSGSSSPSEEDMQQDDLSDDMEEETIAEVDSEVVDFEEHELEHDIAFTLQKRVGCFSHTLKLVARKYNTLKQPKHVLARAHKVVSKVRKSTKATERLTSLAGCKLIGDCPTRWNSTYLIISRMVEVRNELS